MTPSDHAGSGVSPLTGHAPPVETRWKPGQSANPGGRPAFRAFSAAMRRLAELTPDELATYKPKTVAEQVALAAVINASQDSRFMTHLLDRTEGKVPDEHKISGGPQALRITLAEVPAPNSDATKDAPGVMASTEERNEGEAPSE